MKKMRILVLVREGLVPPESIEGRDDKEIAPWKMEFDVISTLQDLGHQVQALGVFDDLGPIRQAILEWKPHIAFMLLEEFHGVGTYDQAIVSYLELMRQHYTGCNPRGLMLTHDKALAKKILTYHHIPTPRFAVFPVGRKVRPPRRLAYPVFVKSISEDASLGIAQASIVGDDEALVQRVRFIHESTHSDAIAEQYIEGRELYVGVLGNTRLQTFPVWEMLFSKMPEDVAPIATAKVKWDVAYQKKYGIKTQAAQDLPEKVNKGIAKLCKNVYRRLNMSGYGRMDLRLRPDGRVFVIEANANPNLEFGEDFAESAESVGINYETLLQRIVNLGLRYQASWKG
ncbi:MAG: D-alanine--D-alanine ligase [Planctomycetales bacterium]|nr:D-alanine--D-alanine ligase [Planctomycetales bacterium]NIP71195.1 D-alanine--D-alanine ligase [Planctomycetales bacterium]